MKHTLILVLALAFTVLPGCQNTPPKPTNANGSFNASVAVGEADLTYATIAHIGASFIANCHATANAAPGCSDALTAQIKAADSKAYAALNAAKTAVATLTPGATGIDLALNDLNAALLFLEQIVPTGAKP